MRSHLRLPDRILAAIEAARVRQWQSGLRVVYIAHPLGNGKDREQNRARASRWVAWAAEQGVAPIADWIVLSGQWGEERREQGLRVDLTLVARCDELWLVGGRVSPGMTLEAAEAYRLGKAIVNLAHLGTEPPL